MSGLDNLSQNIFGLVALLVSLVALCTTVLQVLQQYFSSAEGYRRCHKSVMGLWAKGTHRKLRLQEFRIEVVFETPVIFTARPENRRGPIQNREIYYLDGSDESYTKTKILNENAQQEADAEATARVHTADDERASWVTLLYTLQLKESQSRNWDERWRLKSPPRKGAPSPINPPKYRLAVGLQSKTRSWDFIPSSITKPYATSAICHLVEMMSMLGLYWKVFDQSVWNLRAEGNGFILTSTTVHGLGVMVVFATTGSSKFKENRVIPCEAVKALSFGVVPNIFDDEQYLSPENETQSLELVFGTPDETSYTLESLGCQAETLKRFREDHKHIFSVSFEIVGMLAKVFRIRGSNFRMLPNPTADYWLKNSGKKASWKIARLMEVFQGKLKTFVEKEKVKPCHPIAAIVDQWTHIAELGCTDETNLSTDVREAIHDILDEKTAYLLSISQRDLLAILVAHITEVIDVLADPVSPINVLHLANKEEGLMDYYFNKIRPAVIDNNKQRELDIEDVNVVWVTLIFRMLLWLMLHDFDKADAKIVPSDLQGSRMPVYIG